MHSVTVFPKFVVQSVFIFRNSCLCGLSQFCTRWINTFVNMVWFCYFVIFFFLQRLLWDFILNVCVALKMNSEWSSGFGRVCGYLCCVNVLKVLKMSWCFHCLRIPSNYILSNLILDLYFSSSKQCFPLTCRPICAIHYGWSRNRNFTIYWFPTA